MAVAKGRDSRMKMSRAVVSSTLLHQRLAYCARAVVLTLLLPVSAMVSPSFAQQAPAPARPAPALTAARPLPAPSVERVNGYFNGIKGLEADFLQINPDGRSFSGKLLLLRPGRMRFDYNPPAQLEIVADGRSVAVRDKKLNTQDAYFINQTPLKFLLQPRIDVAKDSKVTDLKREGDVIALSLEDKSTLGGTSRIRVLFDGLNHELREWSVTDSQGHTTRVLISNLNPNANPDRKLFFIDEQRIINPN